MSQRVPQLLSDEPISVDEFGAHTRVARALAELIGTSPGGKSIRLDGAWGVGKSSVIKLLGGHLQTGQSFASGGDAAVFVYDAWVHSGDGLRRAFLESLVRFAMSRKWIRSGSDEFEYWTLKLEEMAGRRKLVRKATEPNFSKGTRFVIASSVTCALISPVAYAVVGKYLDQLDLDIRAAVAAIGAAVLIPAFYKISASSLKVFLTKSTLEETTETITEPEPTSIEFQEMFGRLMETLLHASERKLVIVLDNLDRLEQDETKHIWTLLRSFLDNPEFRSKDWFSKVWLLVPISDENRLVSSSPTEGEVRKSPTALEKIFQVRMSLPLPMLRSWKDYLEKRLKDAFGDPKREEYEQIVRLFHAYYRSDSPTPRTLVTFVNELVALHIERQGDMPLPVIAAYLLAQREEPVVADWRVPGAISQIFHPEGLERDFAALYLHANRDDEAFYLLVQPVLERALLQGSPDELADAIRTTPAAFDVLEGMVFESLRDGERQPDVFFAYASALTLFCDPSWNAATIPSPFLPELGRRIESTLYRLNQLDMLNANLARGVQACISLSVNNQRVVDRFIYLLRTVEPIDKKSPEAGNVQGVRDLWIRTLLETLSVEAIFTGISQSTEDRVTLPVTSDIWGQICLKASDSRFRAAFEIIRARADVQRDAWLVDKMQNASEASVAEAVLRQEIRIQGGDFLDEVAGRLRLTLQTDRDSAPDHVVRAIGVLLRVDQGYGKQFVRDLVENGVLPRFLASAVRLTGPSAVETQAFLVILLTFAWGALKDGSEAGSEFNVRHFVSSYFSTTSRLGGNQLTFVLNLIAILGLYEVFRQIADFGCDHLVALKEMLAYSQDATQSRASQTIGELSFHFMSFKISEDQRRAVAMTIEDALGG